MIMKKNSILMALAALMLLGASSIFTSCSSDDDNNGSNQQAAGDQAVAALKDLVYDPEGNVIFGEAEPQGVYEIGFDEKEDATKLVGKYLNNANYKGGNAVYNLADNRGKVSVTEGTEDGVFYQVEFAVKGIPTMTLIIEETNYMLGKENKTNFWVTYKCKSCSYTTQRSANSAVPYCTTHTTQKMEKK